MNPIYTILTACSVLLFLYYGIASLTSDALIEEFDRWGMSGMRRTTAAFELTGAAGLVAGLFLPVVALAASTGLCLMMILATGVRIRIMDPFYAMIPAIMLGVINAYLAFTAWSLV